MAGKNGLKDSILNGGSARVGVVDVGSNSVRLVVFDGPLRSPSYFFNEKVLCGLGAGLGKTGRLAPDGRERALAAIMRFTHIARTMQLDHLMCVATAAVREAEDGAEFAAEVLAETGLELRVASGEEEAQLSAQGLLMGWPEAEGLIVDIGGASMELARVAGGRIGPCVTSPLGPLALNDVKEKARDKHIAEVLTRLRAQLPGPVPRLYLVGGSWRAIAQIDMAKRAYPLHVLHGYRMTPDALKETSAWIASRTPEELREFATSSMARLSLVPMAARVLGPLLDAFTPDDVAISAYGLREGVLFDLIPDTMRNDDPLILAARATEQGAARFPGFGDALYEWLRPIFTMEGSASLRLIHTACLLHDVTWRAHPDVRASLAFETACRANFSGIDHAGRVFIAMSLAKRYKSSDLPEANGPLASLLDEPRITLADQVGRAIRLGAMMTGSCAETLADTKLEFGEADTLMLTLGRDSAPLFGEAAEKRLARLAKSMGRTHVVQRPKAKKKG
ncbi:exopolyphosphatase/guanosine-5'-triphosphate,3'-diphosphate pyrophosphatase [Rubricella aquisinus]|uniref:Exopolyphosphatase/guanosine-5'-triphosphate, 3'-diphosphate pyrophosphatase n=1 Tax=Rubricella aquisinus TaxID=2028108 RepID=A0A840WLL8_9RHOB|nr:Ppx/GppA family phosphatase [Rubricella aquisinus]MBB5515988.1 exopolyphosphatase/guanosine-5'-triphosphate,3'-diphosphate pyrophosphatase [Rubricella aquisinus]